uniref:Uncharacterized protein n=1 Tax=Acrobeloides nanus TaxID=290746 RepID=A0A914CRT9_9BILA
MSATKKITKFDDKNVTTRKTQSVSEPPVLDNATILAEFKKIALTIHAQPQLDSPIGQAAAKLVSLFQDHVVPKLSNYLSPQEIERQRSVVIQGLPELDSSALNLERRIHEIKAVCGILDQIGVEANLVATYRLGQRNDDQAKTPPPRLLKVIFATRQMQRQVISNAKKLRSIAHFKKVFIQPSLTKEQRDHQFELRKELRERRDKGEDVEIRNNKVVLKKSGNGQH